MFKNVKDLDLTNPQKILNIQFLRFKQLLKSWNFRNP